MVVATVGGIICVCGGDSVLMERRRRVLIGPAPAVAVLLLVVALTDKGPSEEGLMFARIKKSCPCSLSRVLEFSISFTLIRHIPQGAGVRATSQRLEAPRRN